MKICPRLYVSASLEKKKRKIIRQMRHNKKIFSLYCITDPTNDSNTFDIYYYNEWFQKYYKKYFEFTIYGIASSRQEAYELVAAIIEDCMKVQGDCNVRQFLCTPRQP